jgi:hypothetical protein
VCKVLESIIRDEIVNFFDDYNLYSDCQHGFRKKRSCVSQLIEVVEYISSRLDQGKSVDIIYLDFKKAFDSVPHIRLLNKMKYYGISGKVLQWVEDFLKNRTQQVRVDNAKSEQAKVLSGIPQGSILGPILFTIYINDLPNNLQSMCKIFADDTKIYNEAENSQMIQGDLGTLQDWTNQWNLYFNVLKCKVLHIGKKNEEVKYKMFVENDILEIEITDEEKDLGVIFDKNLTFDGHISKIVTKANQIVGIVKRVFKFLDKEMFIKLYKSLIRPHLEYANIIWHPYLKRQSALIERVQRRATKVLQECRFLSYKERLIYLKLHSLKGRRLRGDLIEVYKILHNLTAINGDKFFKFLDDQRTRNSDLKIFIEHSKTTKRRESFKHRVTHHWNSLPLETKHAPTLNSFKNQLDANLKFRELFLEFDS